MVQALENAHDWIDAEKQFFGRAHTGYDFEAQSLSEAQARLAHLEQEQVKLAKRINKKVMGMFEKAEHEYQELMKKKRCAFPVLHCMSCTSIYHVLHVLSF